MSVRRVLVATQFYGRSLTKGLEYKKVYGSQLPIHFIVIY